MRQINLLLTTTKCNYSILLESCTYKIHTGYCSVTLADITFKFSILVINMYYFTMFEFKSCRSLLILLGDM